MKKTQKITVIAIFVALATLMVMIEIPYPFLPFLKFDLSELVILIATETVGLVGTLVIILCKTFIQVFTGSTTPFYIGEITALLASLTFALCFYFTKKMNLVVRLVITSIVFTFVMIVLNFFIVTPIYMTETFDYNNVIAAKIPIEFEKIDFSVKIDSTKNYLIAIIAMYLPFNIIKATLISIVYALVHKPVIGAFKRLFDKK